MYELYLGLNAEAEIQIFNSIYYLGQWYVVVFPHFLLIHSHSTQAYYTEMFPAETLP